ncbi:hypothetical protein A2U01_0107550, partial [Trifolium medium]|nr:hypothetical protein [Trifolium medium]
STWEENSMVFDPSRIIGSSYRAESSTRYTEQEH